MRPTTDLRPPVPSALFGIAAPRAASRAEAAPELPRDTVCRGASRPEFHQPCESGALSRPVACDAPGTGTASPADLLRESLRTVASAVASAACALAGAAIRVFEKIFPAPPDPSIPCPGRPAPSPVRSPVSGIEDVDSTREPSPCSSTTPVDGPARTRPPALPFIPLPHDLTGNTAFERANLAWFNCGWDFGTVKWGDGGIEHNRTRVEKALDWVKDAGVEDVVMWTIPDGRNLTFSANGTPTGLSEGFQGDLYKFLDLLSDRNMSTELVLVDANTWPFPQSENGGVVMQGHGDVITDPTGKKQAAFDDKVLKPMLDTLKQWRADHPGKSLPVSGINVMNEPEWGVGRDPAHPDKNVTSIEQMKAFVRGRTAYIHRNMPGVPVTVGAATPDALFDNWTDAAIGGRPEEKSDYYTFHHYGSEKMSDMARRLPFYKLDKAVHLGEFPGERNADDYLGAIEGQRGSLERAHTQDRFVRSAAIWAATSEGAHTPANPKEALGHIQDWYATSFK